MIRYLFVLVLCCYSLTATEWQTPWTRAVENCYEKDYKSAEKNFTEAISIIEKANDQSAPHIYVDRGRLYFLLERNEECLHDLNRALLNDNLKGVDLQRALVTRMLVWSRLDNGEECLNDLAALKKVGNFPTYEFSQESIIIRNVPDCDCYKKIVSSFLIALEWSKKEDIQFLPSGICIAKRKVCNCGDASSSINKRIENCKNWCDKAAIAGATWCGKAFNKFWCQVACVQAVDFLKDGCYWCCSKGNYYERCIKPFEDIVGAMGNVCDPAWD